jgi:2-phospho-L-lactate/phosphoenolpyruvate guanylyltransferase
LTATSLRHVIAVVPVRSLSGSKSRLGEPLDAEERVDLIRALLRRTVREARAATRLAGVAVVSMDEELLREAEALGATPILQKRDGLNQGLEEARSGLGADASAILVLPVDLPGIAAAAIDRLAEAAEMARRNAPGGPVVILVTDHHGTGTNALLLAPPSAIPFRFGESSRAAHAAAAREAGAAYVEVDGPLSFDLDTPDDLLEVDRRGFGHEDGR